MEKKKLSRKEVVADLKKLFEYDENNRNVIVDEENDSVTFMVNKQYLGRFEVIERLKDYFEDKYIDGGQCRIESLTVVYTVFFIEKI
jgi:hypothetical protein